MTVIDSDEIERRAVEALTAALGVQVWVSLSLSQENEGFTISWYDGPSYKAVTAAAVKLDIEKHWLRLNRVYTPWAWIWVMRRRVQSFTWPKGTTPQQAVRVFEADLAELDIDPPEPAEREWTTRDPARYPPESIAEVMAERAEEYRKAMTSDYRADESRDETMADADVESGDAKARRTGQAAPADASKTRDDTVARSPRRDPPKTFDETRPKSAATPSKRRDEIGAGNTAARDARPTKIRDAAPGVCGHCAGPLPPADRQGRRALYCTQKCRQAAHRKAHRQEPVTSHCEQCGAQIQTGGVRGRPRRYCSNTCKDAAYRASRRAQPDGPEPRQESTRQGDQ